jgi:hypothetical protein
VASCSVTHIIEEETGADEAPVFIMTNGLVSPDLLSGPLLHTRHLPRSVPPRSTRPRSAPTLAQLARWAKPAAAWYGTDQLKMLQHCLYP